MPIISLKVTRPPSSAADHRPPELVKPLLRGNGNTDYQCGNCGSVIAANMDRPSASLSTRLLAPLAERKTSSRLPCAHEPERRAARFMMELRTNAKEAPSRRGELSGNSV